jgi:hypothetical protein
VGRLTGKKESYRPVSFLILSLTGNSWVGSRRYFPVRCSDGSTGRGLKDNQAVAARILTRRQHAQDVTCAKQEARGKHRCNLSHCAAVRI